MVKKKQNLQGLIVPPKDWLAENVLAVCSTKCWGNMAVNGETSASTENFGKLLEALKIKSTRVAIMRPLHSDKIVIVNNKSLLTTGFAKIEGDALITDKANIALGLAAADCLPVFIHDSRNEIIALVHAGREGLKQQILLKVFKKMSNQFGSNPEDVKIFFGPAIRDCCYRFSIEDANNLLPHNLLSAAATGFRQSLNNGQAESVAVCLTIWAKYQLKDVNRHPIPTNVSPYCTCCGKNEAGEYLFFSHRRSQKTKEPEGRFMSLLWRG